MNANRVSGPTAAAYVPLFETRNPTLEWLQNQSWSQLDRYARQLDRIPQEDRATIKWHYEEATGAPWLKGIIATYLAAMAHAYGGEHSAQRAHTRRALLK
jgi:hypothetical protein